MDSGSIDAGSIPAWDVPKDIGIDGILRLGPLIAPMAGVTDAAFRLICRMLGARGLACTEMVSAKGLCYGDRKSFEIARVTDAEWPCSVQIFGADPDAMAKAAALLCGEYPAIFAIDINMGCPMPKITKNGEGSALMRDERRAAAVVEAVAASVNKPVTVKIRKGWDAESSDPAAFAATLEKAGASMVCVHGRTRDQLYAGRADWPAIAAVKRAVSIPVVGNGDIASPDDALRMLNETGCDAVMVGRGAQGNPWLFCDIAAAVGDTAAPSAPPGSPAHSGIAERKAVMLRHLELAVAIKGERNGALEMRKHFAWYVKGMRNAASAKSAIFKASDASALAACLDSFCP